MRSKSGFSLEGACGGSSETSDRVRGAGFVWVGIDLISELCGVKTMHKTRLAWSGRDSPVAGCAGRLEGALAMLPKDLHAV